MIISASRRTDIPRFYLDWFLHRLDEGEVYVRNPAVFHQVGKIDLSRENVDGIVFWSKNPRPMLARLHRLARYPFYIQFTINPYGEDLECNLPAKEELVDTFRRLSDRVGPERMIWRYSPVLLSGKYSREAHLEAFSFLSNALGGYTQRCHLSFIEIYRKIAAAMSERSIAAMADEVKIAMARDFARLAADNGMELRACGNLDLAAAGLSAAKCVDDELLTRITGYSHILKKDRNQPDDCHCVESVDVGAYDTCLNGCMYCYANRADLALARRKHEAYDVHSAMLCSGWLPGDEIIVRRVRASKERQMRLF